jgi:hypothetical protein
MADAHDVTSSGVMVDTLHFRRERRYRTGNHCDSFAYTALYSGHERLQIASALQAQGILTKQRD